MPSRNTHVQILSLISLVPKGLFPVLFLFLKVPETRLIRQINERKYHFGLRKFPKQASH